MNKQYSTEQEAFWAGEFGNDYIARNTGADLTGSNAALYSQMIANCAGVESLIELGANIGVNLRAIQHLCPAWTLDALEINEEAVKRLRDWGGLNKVYHDSILKFQPDRQWDVVLVNGVLIHINPDHLAAAYATIVQASKRYIFLIEYYNPTPVEVPYRGHMGRLFKRDFAGEMLDKYPALRVLDYGFVWRRDPVFPMDDATWFVLEKS
jgi:pseudaminic acid biosynthesis-associated methylase